MTRNTLTAICTAIPSISAWLGGYDFDGRGLDTACLFIATVIMFALAGSYPGVDK